MDHRLCVVTGFGLQIRDLNRLKCMRLKSRESAYVSSGERSDEWLTGQAILEVLEGAVLTSDLDAVGVRKCTTELNGRRDIRSIVARRIAQRKIDCARTAGSVELALDGQNTRRFMPLEPDSCAFESER